KWNTTVQQKGIRQEPKQTPPKPPRTTTTSNTISTNRHNPPPRHPPTCPSAHPDKLPPTAPPAPFRLPRPPPPPYSPGTSCERKPLHVSTSPRPAHHRVRIAVPCIHRGARPPAQRRRPPRRRILACHGWPAR